MKQIDIINAYKASEDLSKATFSKEDEWKIYNLRKALRPRIEFQEEQEKKLAEKYTSFADKDGNLKGEKYIEYMQELQELMNLEVESVESITLPLIEGVSFKTIEALENLIEFKP